MTQAARNTLRQANAISPGSSSPCPSSDTGSEVKVGPYSFNIHPLPDSPFLYSVGPSELMRIFSLNARTHRGVIYETPGFRLDGELREGKPFLHFIWTGKVAWTPTEYKKILLAISEILGYLDSIGQPVLYVYVPPEQIKVALAGGFIPTVYMTMEDETTLILMEQDTCLR